MQPGFSALRPHESYPVMHGGPNSIIHPGFSAAMVRPALPAEYTNSQGSSTIPSMAGPLQGAQQYAMNARYGAPSPQQVGGM